MNFQSVLEELDRLYEEDATKENKEADVAAEDQKEEEVLTEAAEEGVEADEEVDEVEEVEDPVIDEEPEAEEAMLVLECAKCGGLVIKAEADVKVDDDTDLANMDDACQYCEEAAGYTVIGTFTPYVAEVVEDDKQADEAAEEVVEDEIVEEGLLDVDVPVSVDVKADGNNVSVGTLG